MMTDIKTIEGDFTSGKGKYALVVGRWNSFVVEHLLEGAIDTLRRHGADERDLEIIRVPGAYEMPIAAQRLAASKRFEAIIALGAVIRGGTPHFDYVSSESIGGLGRVALDCDIPIGNGILTVDTMQQAVDRAGGSEGNKGEEAALAAIDMVHVLRDMGT